MLMANFVMTGPMSNLHDNIVLVCQHGVEMAYQYMFIVLVYYKCSSPWGTQYQYCINLNTHIGMHCTQLT